ncbi:hypothetical protein [Dermatobacter hominis]|uniref:hypothetical protein n=1 Tax=Dermatobacter hominis TaxID=2884263 RepID=UPI001D12D91F|nr:hypothetical protein [Dermatobacter hominis]UDY34304.1 hypothetical protein LH044_13260 [Dermatobacter hominis]
MGTRRRNVARIALGAAFAAIALAACAPDPGPPPTTSLAGENLTSWDMATIVSGTCNPAGESTFTLEVSGDAAGPYPGTFTETMSVILGPQTEEFLPGQFRGHVTSFESTATITGANGPVSVASTLDASSFTAGVCSNSASGPWTITGQIYVDVDYQATAGPATASGTANVQFNMIAGNCSCTGSAPEFHHTFAS